MLTRPLSFVAALLIGGALAAAGPAGAQAQDTPPTVVELFTSQGCNSCPPADAYLGDLAGRDDVLALSFHVNYWDYLGWKDTFATPGTTGRQRAYGRSLGKRYVYTPQMVIGGIAEAVGSERQRVEREIEKARIGATSSIPVEATVPDQGQVIVRIGAGQGRAAAVWLVRYDRRHEVEIGRGENGGKSLAYHNVVRDITRIGTWEGEAVEIALSVAELREGGRDACAVLLQEEGQGAILGAARIALDGNPG